MIVAGNEWGHTRQPKNWQPMTGNNLYNQARLRQVNDLPLNSDGEYVLYWMQIYRRFDHNHALNYALAVARHLRKPLVIYEGLKLTYPWASRRLHTFILEGMLENRRTARKRGLNYWPFVETPNQSGRGLVRQLASRAAAVVTDDFPCFIIPEQTAALANKRVAPVIAVDGNGIVPMALLGPPVYAAAHLRPRLHRAFADAWGHRAGSQPEFSMASKVVIEPPFPLWQAEDLTEFIAALPLDATVFPVVSMTGGPSAAKKRLRAFITHRLTGYASNRSQPAPPEKGHGSGLSPYLHFGHISIEEIAEEVLNSRGKWQVDQLNPAGRGKREGFFSPDIDVNSFLEEALTWRDVGFNWHWGRRGDTKSLQAALPSWAWHTLHKHAADHREHLYSLEEWENAQTHDELWNAAQRELVATGTVHNYLRMLWGKKVLEWSATPEQAFQTLVHLNNKYALDGRNPNSYTGILWCFGLFDRPWAPERDVFGVIRFMSSSNTAKKFKMGAYLDYVRKIGTEHPIHQGPEV